MIVISHSDYPIIFGDSQDYWIITDALNQNISLDAVLDLGDGACLDLGDGAILVLQSNVSVAVGDGTIVIIPNPISLDIAQLEDVGGIVINAV